MIFPRTKRPHDGDESAMEVDEDGEEGAKTDTDEEDEDEDEEDSMSVDGDSQETPKQKKKKPKASKLKPRKSQLDMDAFTQEQAAVAALEADELLRLKLKRKYYAEAMTFIHQIENAMDVLTQLLGSTNKAEVLETMEFFRYAYSYELEGAKVILWMHSTDDELLNHFIGWYPKDASSHLGER